jgi:hypothetical protein
MWSIITDLKVLAQDLDIPRIHLGESWKPFATANYRDISPQFRIIVLEVGNHPSITVSPTSKASLLSDSLSKYWV